MRRVSYTELLEQLQNPVQPDKPNLINSSSTWNRIRNKDKFEELGLSSNDLETFLSEWIKDNPYSNI